MRRVQQGPRRRAVLYAQHPSEGESRGLDSAHETREIRHSQMPPHQKRQ